MRISHSSWLKGLMFGSILGLMSGPAMAQETPPSPKVSVAAAYTDDLVDQVTFLARGEAIDKVEVLARVSGFVQDVAVGDGEPVKEGDLLFQIDPETYLATLAARKADKAQAVANLKLSEVELERKSELFRRGSGTEADRDKAVANNEVAKAQVHIADAAIALAQLDVNYTKVTAPFDGRVGRAHASVGELVGPSSAPLITLVRVAPMYVEFSLTEKQLIKVMESFNAHTAEEVVNNPKSPDVFVTLPNGQELEEPGRVVFADNLVDPATGTISMRAESANEKGLIVDGSFLKVRIEDIEPRKVLMIPQAALQRDQRGDFVLVVGSQQTVEQRYVTLGRQVETAIVVEDGLREGESVIVEGLQRVRPGVTVDAVLAGTGQGQ